MKKIKRYVIFGGFEYYPCGGSDDFFKSFSTKHKAVSEFKKHKESREVYDWVILYDRLKEEKLLSS